MTEPDAHLEHLARDIVTRAAAIVGLAGIALIHLLDSVRTYGETRYVFWLYVALMVGCLVLAGALLRASSAALWVACGALAALVIVAYVLSRTTGLPDATDDIGRWSEPLGLASLFVEGCVVAVSVYGFSASGFEPGWSPSSR